ncbi:MAG: hypothetical protein CYPHOPRED_000264 [Cyphobasidiales sp. Tagirdzhanova-0007]|nr:MAG: hypothetical protein CYPHOPRED_000264 [Cyphobasidiales sp. Tagirdzhanova-0007]
MAAGDRRRFNGPEGTAPIRYIDKKELLALVDPTTNLRADGRKAEDLRPIFLKTGLVPQADGSAYIETGKAKIMCAVYGPHPARRDAPFSARAKLNVEVKFVPFACPGRRRTPGKDTESPLLSAQLSQALLPSLRLDLLPKSAIDLFVTILECDGPLGDISPGITAASVALAEAGVQMLGLVVSCCKSFAVNGNQNTILLDPTYAESTRSQGILTLSCMPAMSSATNVSFQGSVSRALFKEVGLR